MARLPRLHVPGGWYYLTVRGHRHRNIFPRPAHRWLFEQFVADAAARARVRIHAFCWMSNCIRLLVRVEEFPVGTFMQHLCSRYAGALRQRSPFTGRLFQARYDVLLFDADRYFLELLCAIHLDPVRAGSVAQPQEYRWSSHRIYLGIDARAWVCASFGLGLLHRQRKRARDMYQHLVQARVADPPDPDSFQGHQRDPRVLGDQQFLSSLDLRSMHATQNSALVELVEEVCRSQQITLEALRSPCQSRLLSRARGLIAVRGLQREAASLSEIARYLNRSASAVARSFQRHRSDDYPGATGRDSRQSAAVD